MQAVINDSPAFAADMLRGDIITSFAGEKVINPDQFFDLVIQNAGRSVQVEINRSGAVKTLLVQLKAE